MAAASPAKPPPTTTTLMRRTARAPPSAAASQALRGRGARRVRRRGKPCRDDLVEQRAIDGAHDRADSIERRSSAGKQRRGRA